MARHATQGRKLSPAGFTAALPPLVLLALFGTVAAGELQAQPRAADPADVGPPLPSSEAPSPAGPPRLVSWLEARIEYEALARQERWADALPVAEQVVALSEREHGTRHRDTASAHVALANVLHQLERHDEAELAYLHAIDLLREIDGPNSQSLLQPMLGLGDNYHDSRQFANAVAAYGEARTVTRRLFGLLSEEQIPILQRTSASLLQMNRMAEAGESQQAALELIERNHGERSPEFVEALHSYALWLRRVGRFSEERMHYSRAVRLIRDMSGDESTELVRPLRETANSFRTQRLSDQQGANALNRALSILRSQPDSDVRAFAELLRDFGDWQTAFARPGSESGADELYLQSWHLLGLTEGGDRLREEWYSGVHFVLREPVSQRGVSYEEFAVPGYVVVEFEIDAEGLPLNTRLAASDPPGFKDEDALRAVSRSRFRPEIVDGQIVAAAPRALRISYHYLPNDRR